MNVLFIIQDRDMPSSRVRVLNLVPDLEKAGIRCTIRAYPHTIGGKLGMLREVVRADVVVLQKKLPSPVDAFMLRRLSRRLLYDFDDAVHERHESDGPARSRSRAVKARAVMRRADAVIAGNRILKEYASRHCRTVHVVPSAVEVRGIPIKRHEPSGGPVVIGWVGGHINLGHLKLLGGLLRRLSERHDIVLHVVCDRGLELPGVKVVHVPWSLEQQEAEVARFDIGIMPLPDSPHAAGKCGYKALQCMAAGVPVVVSDIGINREIVRDGTDGFVVRDDAGFEEALERLITGPALRVAMGDAARKRAKTGFSVEIAAAMMAGILQGKADG